MSREDATASEYAPSARSGPDSQNPETKQFFERFQREDPRNPGLKKLREQYGLGEIIAPGADEFEQLLLLNEWAYERIKVFGRPTVQTENALEILARAAEGHTFYCAHYAIVFCAAAMALGWDARPVSLRRHDFPQRVSNHNVVEVWAKQYAKWVMFEPTLKAYVEKNGVPQSVYEISRAWFRDRGEGLVFRIGPQRAAVTPHDFPAKYRHYPGYGWQQLGEDNLACYACLAYIPTNRLLGAYPERSIERWDDWPELFVLCGLDKGWQEDVSRLPPYYPSRRRPAP